MTLAQLLTRMSVVRVTGAVDQPVSCLCHDSRQMVAGGVFFALRGQAFDGHRFIDQAVAAGAAAVVLEEPLPLPQTVTSVLVADSRLALAQAAAGFFGDPAEAGPVIGVTGTNGKTTTTYLVEALLQQHGRHPAVFGTVSYRFASESREASHTTPDALELLQIAADFRRAGADALIMEVSSHALDQYRVDGISYRVGVFTNLTPEHLDYHLDMERYFASKRRFFVELLARSGGQAVICTDDAYGVRLAAELPQAITCGQSSTAQVHPLQATFSLHGIHAEVVTPAGMLVIDSPLIGRFNLQNLLCAAATGLALGMPLAEIATGLAGARQVPGRVERIENNRGALILVDYAHTGDALDKVLSTLVDLKPRRIITVFGCGGDRDRRKRPVMGEVAARYSDLVVVTSDNPRTEAAQAIIDEILPGVQRIHARALTPETARRTGERGYLCLADRRTAIDFAVSLLQAGDLLLVAGKGHEDYQIIGREKFHFDDREELRRALASAGAVE